MDGDIDRHNMSVYSREFEKVYYMYHFNYYITRRLISSVFYKGWNKITSNATANHRQNNSVVIFRRVMFFFAFIFCL